jgi:hypothetical protein
MFWHRYYVRSGTDFCYVEVSEDGGFNWSELASYTGYTTTLFPEQIDLSNYKTSPILIRFRLRDNGDGYRYDGWDIDDVELKDLNPTNLNEITNKIPSEFSLQQNYPNPFNPSTKVKYEIPERSFVTLKVYDVLGKEVATLVNDEKPAGVFEFEFNGAGLTSGIYFYKLQVGDFVETRKMVLLR